jgi:hypothetical protein
MMGNVFDYYNELVKIIPLGYDDNSKYLAIVTMEGVIEYTIYTDGTVEINNTDYFAFSTETDNIWNYINGGNLVTNYQLQQCDSTIRQDFDSYFTDIYNTIDDAVSYIENDAIGGKLEEYDTSIKGYINNNCVTNQALDDFATETISFVEQSLNDFSDTCDEQFINNTELEEYDTSIKNHITNETNTLKNSINTDFSNFATYVETNFATKDQLDNALGDIESLLGGI